MKKKNKKTKTYTTAKDAMLQNKYRYKNCKNLPKKYIKKIKFQKPLK